MLVRALLLVALVGMVTSSHHGGSTVPTGAEELDEQPESRGFGRFMTLVAAVGVLILATILILAILSLSGVFVSETADPPV